MSLALTICARLELIVEPAARADLTDLLIRFIDEHIPASSLDTLRRRRSNGD